MVEPIEPIPSKKKKNVSQIPLEVPPPFVPQWTGVMIPSEPIKIIFDSYSKIFKTINKNFHWEQEKKAERAKWERLAAYIHRLQKSLDQKTFYKRDMAIIQGG